jgi:hypothetical protein
MVKTVKRPLTSEERQKLLHLRPSFLLRERRRAAQQELDEGVAEVLDLEVLRAWDMNGCRPPCCPHIYLFQVGERDYVYAESWTAFNFPDEQFPKRRIEIARSPLGKRILSANAEGEVVRLEDSPFDPATEYFSFSGAAECEIWRVGEMPEEVWSMLSAT